jgi:enterochelin esterase-like enzyme
VVHPGIVRHGWSTSNAGRRSPVLYLLHGAPGQPSDWTDGAHVNLLADEFIAKGQMRPLIMVMPEGNGGVWHDSQYVDGVTCFATVRWT